MRVIGWRCENIRGNLRDVAIDLGDPPPRWTLIQMNNGGGKTTTMALIRAALTGHIDAEAVKGFRPDDGESTGLFELRVTIDGHLHVITLRFDYVTGQHRYSTARAAEVGGGLVDHHRLPDDVRMLMTPDFAELFAFDGELARKIRNNASDRASRAVRTLYGIDRLASLHATIKRLLEQQQKNVAGVTQAKDKRHVERLRGELQSAKQRLSVLEKQLGDLKRERGDARSECDRIGKEIGDKIGQNKDAERELSELEDKLSRADRVIQSDTDDLRAKLQSPFLANPRGLSRLRELSSQLQALQLPASASAEFFEELAEGDRCVCDEPITPEMKEKIRSKAASYMAADESGIINNMKTQVRLAADDPAVLEQPVETLRGRIRERHKVKQSLDAKRAAFIAAGGEELSALEAEGNRLEREIGRFGEQIERLESADPEYHITNGLGWEHNIPKCKTYVAECEDRYNTATHTHQLLLQSRIAQKVLTLIEHEALIRLREKVRTATNLKLAQLVPAERLEVAKIGDALEISGANLARKENVSEGQSLSIAYAFLASLFESANHRLPFIIDSPALPLDAEMRREVIKVVPELFEQTIMFVISTERQEFADAFYSRPDARFITLVRKPGGFADQLEGEEAFKCFQDDELPVDLGAAA